MIDIIITTYNRKALLEKTWLSFTEHTKAGLIGKIIISNDGSTDGTKEYLDMLRNHARVEVLPRENERLGLVPRFNMALELCTADIVCEFQDDVEFYPGWLDKQLQAIYKADFITGYDAPEHSGFDADEDGILKYSAGFIQLTAKRSTWNKYFPMEPLFDFPTPAIVDGRHYGSGIDTRIYNRKKNNPQSGVTYLVIPGLIHKAHHFNSTWRPDVADTHQRFTMGKPGGLTAETVIPYWKNRYDREGTRAVGYGNRPSEEQTLIINAKRDFIAPWVDRDKLTIDYGCGIGLMTPLFDPLKYFGCDITQEFIWAAQDVHPAVNFSRIININSIGAVELSLMDQFFTSNVLQHNCDQAVAYLFKSLAERRKKDFTFLLYENTHRAPSTAHMRFRTVQEYYLMVAEHFTVRHHEAKTHTVHGEEHTLMRFEV